MLQNFACRFIRFSIRFASLVISIQGSKEMNGATLCFLETVVHISSPLIALKDEVNT
jgi:hypothetical protein